jgi:hypothetical protein
MRLFKDDDFAAGTLVSRLLMSHDGVRKVGHDFSE